MGVRSWMAMLISNNCNQLPVASESEPVTWRTVKEWTLITLHCPTQIVESISVCLDMTVASLWAIGVASLVNYQDVCVSRTAAQLTPIMGDCACGWRWPQRQRRRLNTSTPAPASAALVLGVWALALHEVKCSLGQVIKISAWFPAPQQQQQQSWATSSTYP